MSPFRCTIAQAIRDQVIQPAIAGKPDDLFLACASFEPRSVKAAECLSPTYRARQAIIYANSECLEGCQGVGTRPHLYQLITILARHADRVDVVEGSLFDAPKQLETLRKALLTDWQPQDQQPTVTIDTTTFNRESLLIASALLRSFEPKPTVRAVYVSPSDHGPWLSRGFRSVRNVVGFSGVQDPSQPTVLAILAGFEPDRVLKVIDEHEPKKVLMGIGDPPTTERFLARNIAEQQLVLSRQDVEEFRFATTDIHECYAQLRSLMEPCLRESNVVLAPMSTKLSTLAVLLLVEEFPQIQVTYCVPGEYNVREYSSGADTLFIDGLPP